MKKISIIGAGTMGNGIAQVFAMNNYHVNLIDLNSNSLSKGINSIMTNLDRMIKRDIISSDQKRATLDNIITTMEINSAESSDLVIEAVTENIEIKLKLFKQLDQICSKETILATNTSSISITEIAASTNRPEKVIGMHFMNPVPIMKLIEVIRGRKTSDETTKSIIGISETIKKIAIEVNDYPGFIANRILLPMINEAIEALNTGVAEVSNIDSIMKIGMGYPMGPLQLADFIGLDVCLSILEVMYKGFKDSKYAPSELLVNMVKSGKLGVKSGEGFYDYSESKKAELVAKQFK
ncbi:MAG: 3-hydroxybutyryl-CoA dehydrogenase [Flavobacteriaceae bacterium]|jgi:3-hydroxybutyryl-CoA dehydrogenase|nr:3-hydroxybutyryl-CoA dehydrogenase [Flavobacteriaceae bacterium]MBT4112457.1 3-hydroxybutyryl-CoA dehydrogenase [Flavobacteriaceae bacterium]MBT4614311.1 3-hydroxybutyryl-CoA dehydrogenase [Flavobacteriaceae bacterium]MBT5246764.1 3-hydroxybutyryl-CoA dehydrogenase [Flavobacteriaceae bacterium]MBT5649949.1 3-hydroxybutyryl-CoA dehydrogenase [Flavobacteriaceae bacterium]